MPHYTKMTFVRWTLKVCRIIAPMSNISKPTTIIFGVIIRFNMVFLSLNLLPASTLFFCQCPHFQRYTAYVLLNMLFLACCNLQMRHV